MDARYTTTAIALHWATAIAIVVLLLFGEDMVKIRAGATDFTRSIHAGLGMLVLALTAIRLGWRLANPPPPLPPGGKAWEVKLSKLTHGIFYALMLFLPLSGWLAASALFFERNISFSVAGLFGLPVIPVPDLGEFYEAIHSLAGDAMWVLLALHVLAALKHQFIDKDNLLARMRPM